MNSLYHVISGVIKYYRFTWHTTVWRISVQNINMLLAVIPEYRTDEEEEDEGSLRGLRKGGNDEDGEDEVNPYRTEEEDGGGFDSLGDIFSF